MTNRFKDLRDQLQKFKYISPDGAFIISPVLNQQTGTLDFNLCVMTSNNLYIKPSNGRFLSGLISYEQMLEIRNYVNSLENS
jgi:hypothetical protein